MPLHSQPAHVAWPMAAARFDGTLLDGLLEQVSEDVMDQLAWEDELMREAYQARQGEPGVLR